MNILLATPLYSQYYDAGHFWLRALNQLSHAVTVWDYRLDRKPPPFTKYPDFILVLKGEGLDPRSLPSPRAVYWPDALERTPGVEETLRLYDKAFTPVRPTPDWMEWLPTGWDPAIHKDLKVERLANTVYIGTANSDYKVKTMRVIMPELLKGNNWAGQYGGIGSAVYLHEYVSCLNQAKILIDVHQSPTVGLNRKFFEMISCGFTIVDRVPGVDEVLGQDLSSQVSFVTPEEAKWLIRHFLEHPEEREELWKLEKEAIKPYTYQAAAEKVLSYLRL